MGFALNLTYSSIILFLTLFSHMIYFVNASLPISQSTVTLTRLIPKSKNKTDQTLLSLLVTHTHTLSLSHASSPIEDAIDLGS